MAVTPPLTPPASGPRRGLPGGLPGERPGALPGPLSGGTPQNRAAAPPRRTTRRRLIEAVVIFVGCVLLLDALVGERGLIVMMRAAQDNRGLEQRLETLKTDNDRMKAEIELMKRDRDTIEDLARQKLGLMKRGEKVFSIRDANPQKK